MGKRKTSFFHAVVLNKKGTDHKPIEGIMRGQREAKRTKETDGHEKKD